MASVDALCLSAEAYAKSRLLRCATAVGISLCVTTIVCTICWFAKRFHRRLALHQNLKVIFNTTIAISCVYSVGALLANSHFIILSFAYTDPCQLPVPIWFVETCMIPMYFFFAAFPFCHLMISLERIYATTYAKTYEGFRPIFGWIASAVVICVSLTYTTFKVAITLSEMRLTDRLPFVLSQTKGADNASLKMTYVLVAIDICATTADIFLIFINRRKVRALGTEYSLSHSYQLKENIVATLRLVFPLGVCNAILFFAFLCSSGFLRFFRPSMDIVTFQAFLKVSGILTVLQAPISAAIIMLYMKRPKATTAVADASEQSRLYFDHFRQQVGADRPTPDC